MNVRILSAVIGPVWLGACVGGNPARVDLPLGRRVQFTTAGAPLDWTMGVVGEVGSCTAIMIPDSWEAPQQFEVVRIDSITGLRVRIPGQKGEARRVDSSAASSAATWDEVSMRAVHARYGGCVPGV
jgi:hypothetical protein